MASPTPETDRRKEDPVVRQELEDIQRTVHDIDRDKMNKPRLAVVVTIVIALITTFLAGAGLIIYGAWWMGNFQSFVTLKLETTQELLKELRVEMKNDRYTNTMSNQDKLIQSGVDKAQDAKIQGNDEAIKLINDKIRALHPRK